MKWGALRAAEVFVLPSHQENFGIAVAEALAVGAPALISNKVNIWREIESDGAGIAADDTLDGTCKLLQSYIGMQEERKLAMRQAARECFEQRFEIRKAAETLHTILASVSGSELAALENEFNGQCSGLATILISPWKLESSWVIHVHEKLSACQRASRLIRAYRNYGTAVSFP